MDGSFFNLITAIGTILALLVGGWIKRSGKSSKIIPWITLVISILTQLTNNATDAHASTGGLMLVGFSLGGFLKVLAESLLQTFITTGIHSTAKNAVIEPLMGKK